MEWIILIVFAFTCILYLMYWACWTYKRIEEVSVLRIQLVNYVFKESNNCKERLNWYESQISFKKMSPLDLLSPLTSKPLSTMIKGKFKEDFWRWKNEERE